MTKLLRDISITSTICDLHKIEVKPPQIVCMHINLKWNFFFLMDWQDRDYSYLAGTVCTRCNWGLSLPFPANSYKENCASNLLHLWFTGQYSMPPFLSNAIEDCHYQCIGGFRGGALD